MLPLCHYHGILATPPWTCDAATRATWPRLPVAALAATEGASLWLACPTPHLPEAMALVAQWGFAYKTLLICENVGADGFAAFTGPATVLRHSATAILIAVHYPPGCRDKAYLKNFRAHRRLHQSLLQRCPLGWALPYPTLRAEIGSFLGKARQGTLVHLWAEMANGSSPWTLCPDPSHALDA